MISILLAQVWHQDSPAQSDPAYIMHTSPYPAFHGEEPQPYNLKWGRLSGRFHGAVQAEFNDNINLSANDPTEDIIVSPHIGIGFLWPLTEQNVLQFDLGVGYRFHLLNPHLNQDSIHIFPNSRFNYQIRVLKAQISVHDNFYVQVDPMSNPNISGTGQKVINFRRFVNTAGIQVAWQAIRDTTFLGGYDYNIDRTLTSDFSSLDRDDHIFFLGAYRPLNPRITLGINASYKISEYVEQVQNDFTTFSVGPVLIVKLTEFISLNSGVSYTISDYHDTGTISDQTDFEGLNFNAGVRHIINSKMSHSLQFTKSLSPGAGNNFSDVFAAQYGFSWKAMSAMSLNGIFTFEDITASNGADDSFRYMLYLGTGLRLTKRWTMSGGYSLSWKDSSSPDRSYTQNRVTIDLRRQF